ncbi:MAG: hypothetical protein QI197_00335 [Candidatus Korarchaeota archaeon]|nr:hypothetical protein [Candidatus Korarchaeota archaeon]
MRLNVKVIAPVIMAAIMLIGVISMSSPPSPLGGEEWPLPPADTPLENITSNMNISNFVFFGGQPVASLGTGLDFPLGSTAFYYVGAYKNNTFVAFVVAKLPDPQYSVQFGGRALNSLKENLPEENVRYLVTNEGGFLQYQGTNQTLVLWYGHSWYFEIMAGKGGDLGREAVQAIKRAIYEAIQKVQRA